MSRGYFAVGMVRPRDPANIGSVVRATHCFGGALVAAEWRGGVQFSTDTAKAWRHMPVMRTDDLKTMIPYDCMPVAVEITPDAVSLADFAHPERAFYVFGPEDGSIPARIMAWCPKVVSIPSRHCLNLAGAVNVVLYDRAVKRGEGFCPIPMGASSKEGRR